MRAAASDREPPFPKIERSSGLSVDPNLGAEFDKSFDISMAKPMLVTLPFVLLLLDYWALGRIQFQHLGDLIRQPNQRLLAFRLVWEKTPLFIVVILSSMTPFKHTLDVTSNNWLAHNNIGNVLAGQGKTDEAINPAIIYSNVLCNVL